MVDPHKGTGIKTSVSFIVVAKKGKRMKRIALMVIKLIWVVPYWFAKISYMAKGDRYTEEERYNFLRKLVLKANKAGRVKVEVTGLEHLPKENGFIIFPNHQGMFDVLAIIEAVERPLTAVMKKELANIILVKQVRELIKALPLDREDPREGMRVIKQMSEEVKMGRNYIIFAEGTRTKNPNKTQEFKGGSFKAAYYAKCPIVPLVEIDCYKPFDTDSIAPVTVQLHFLEPLYYEDYKDMKTVEVAALVRGRIDKVIEEKEAI